MNQKDVKQHILAYIGFGSNLGDRVGFLMRAQQALNDLGGTIVLRLSSLYKTEPHTCGGSEQPWYLNVVFEAQTNLSPSVLLSALKNIEKDLGRVEATKWAPRIVDLDLLFYGDQILEAEGLCVPHREIAHRRFVLQPLCDLVPDKIHPVLKKNLRELLAECQDAHKCLSVSSFSF